MKVVLVGFFTLMAISSSFGQGPGDSAIAKLNGKNIPVLRRQLNFLFDHNTLKRIESDPFQWPVLRYQLTRKIDIKAKEFDPGMQVVIGTLVAGLLARERQLASGYARISDALQRTPLLPKIYQATVYLEATEVFHRMSRLDSAIWYAEKAFDISQGIKNDSIQKAALDLLALMNYRTKNYAKAEYYFKILDHNPLTQPNQRRDYYNTIGLSFRNQQSYDSAIYYFIKSRDIATEQKDTIWMGLTNGNIGYVYFLQKRYDEALPGLLLDLRYSLHGDRNYQSALKTLSTITSIYAAKGNNQMAKFYYDSLVRNIKWGSDSEVRLEYLRASANYFEKSGNFEKATGFLHAFNDLEDSLRDIENVARASQLQAQFESDRQLRRIEALERQSTIDAAANRQKNYLLIGSVLLVVLAVGLITQLYRSNRFKHNVNKILTDQNARIGEQAEHLNHLNNTKDKLFSIISHDLRGPINSLKALMGMVRRDIITPEEFKHFSGQLQNNVEYVNFTLDNVLYWSRSQLQGIEAHPQPTLISDLVVENINLFSEPLREKKISAENALSPDLKVMADPNQVRLVFRNLIGNAIKFTSHGGQISIRSFSENGHEVFSIEDTGMGMSADALDNIFTPRVTTTAGTNGEKGTGLGLSLCKEMIEKNKGTIWVDESSERGTTFKFTLPRI